MVSHWPACVRAGMFLLLCMNIHVVSPAWFYPPSEGCLSSPASVEVSHLLEKIMKKIDPRRALAVWSLWTCLIRYTDALRSECSNVSFSLVYFDGSDPEHWSETRHQVLEHNDEGAAVVKWKYVMLHCSLVFLLQPSSQRQQHITRIFSFKWVN